MNKTLPPIYAPSLYWFTYQYHEGLVIFSDAKAENSQAPVNLPINHQWVKNQYETILTAFEITLEFDIREDKPSRQFDLLSKSDAESGRRYASIKTEDKKLEGFIYPQCLHDSYALNLNIFCPEKMGEDEYAVTDLGNLNPNNCFNPPASPAAGYIGQTLFLSAYLKQSPPENVHDLADLAKQCWLSFFQIENPEKNPEQFPPLYRAAKWFGGYLYEYGDPRVDLRENPYGHLLIWFLFDESPTKLLQKCYWELPELLLYYHKVSKTFQDSRVFYATADKIVRDNETELNEFKQKYLSQETVKTLSEDELQTLKTTLKRLLKTSLAYSQELRNLEYAQNTIAINTKNYQATLEYMTQLAATPLEVFQIFDEKEAVIFQAQISADLNYFKQGYYLLDTAIASIRGLVEVDQAERDRILQNQNQQLQDHFQSIGVGIAAGAIVASTSGLIFQDEMTYPWQENYGKDLHPFSIAVLLSAACALGFWGLCFVILKIRRTSANSAKNKK
jgi:hypothetical protein